jgi:hypothetical protein
MTGRKGSKGKSKAGWYVTAAALGILGGVLLGLLIGPFVLPRGSSGVTVCVTVTDDFGLSFDGGEVNETYNCTSFGIYAFTVSRNVFDAIQAFFAENKTKMLAMDNISTETGIDYVILGFVDYFYSDDADFWGSADNETCVEGQKACFTFGDNVLLFWEVYVSVWYNGTTHYEDFSAAEIIALDAALLYGNLTRAVWLEALPFIYRGVDSIVVSDWQQMSLVDDQLDVTINGVDDTLYEYGFGP